MSNIAKGNLHAPTLLSLADGIERGCRKAPAGTRGAITEMTPGLLTIFPVPLDDRREQTGHP